jgi:hypothetical protein
VWYRGLRRSAPICLFRAQQQLAVALAKALPRLVKRSLARFPREQNDAVVSKLDIRAAKNIEY